MALSVKSGTFVQAAGTGDQSVTGVGFQPKAILFWGSSPTEGFLTQTGEPIGFAVSSSSRCAITGFDRNGQATMDANRGHSNVHCYALLTGAAGGGSMQDAADFVSFDADGFTINWGTNGGSLRIINFFALGGTDLTTVAIKEFQSPTSTGDQSVTGVGFQPDCAVFLTASINAAPSPGYATGIASGIGWATSSNARVASGIGAVDNVADAVTNRVQVNTKCISTCNNDAALIVADLKSFDADGFTVTWSTVAATSRFCWALCLKGGQYNVGTDTQKTSTGTKATTGVGFAPIGLLIASVGAAASASIQSHVSRSLGSVSSTSARNSNWQGSDDAAATSDTNRYQDDASCISIGDATDTILAQADLSSLDSDGFTLNWGTADATAREFIYLAFGDTPVSATPRRLALLGVGI